MDKHIEAVEKGTLYRLMRIIRVIWPLLTAILIGIISTVNCVADLLKLSETIRLVLFCIAILISLLALFCMFYPRFITRFKTAFNLGLQYSESQMELIEKAHKFGIVNIHAEDGSEDERIKAYNELRSKSKSSILIMGLGMSNLSTKDCIFRNLLLEKKVNVRILMLDPKVFSENCNFPKIEQFNSYFCRKNYHDTVRISHEAIKTMAKEINNKAKEKAEDNKDIEVPRIEIRTYTVFYPLNFTVIDHDPRQNGVGELIMEFYYPYTSKSILFNSKNNSSYFKITSDSIYEMWNNANPVDIEN